MMPSAADAASWLDKWNKVKKQGEQVYKDTVEAITPPSEEQPEQRQEPAAGPQPSYGKVQVRQVQVFLIKLGYDPGSADGTYGPATAAAIEAYQADHNLLKTGKLSDALIAHMQETLTSRPTAATSTVPPGGTPGQPVSQPGSTTSGALSGSGPAAKWSAAGPFAGFTLIRLNDKKAHHAIAGNYNSATVDWENIYLITFVSAAGTYTAVSDRRSGINCVAWSAAGGGEGKSITFGIKMDAYEGRPGIPWCQPFTLTLQGSDKVRLVADNEVPGFGRKGSGMSKRISHDGVHDIIQRLPSVEPDFSLPAFGEQAIYNISLGPIAPRDSSPRIRIKPNSPSIVMQALTHNVEINFAAFPGKSYGGNLYGHAAPAELGGWSDDQLIALWNSEKLGENFVPSNIFNSALINYFGNPTVYRNDKPGGMWWMYDRNGRLLTVEDSSASNCLATFELWKNIVLWQFNKDIGPWGCSLVKLLSHDAGNYPTVSASEEQLGLEPGSKAGGPHPTPPDGHNVTNSREEMVAGDAMAFHHFMIRLGELAEAREKLGVAASDGRKTPVVIQSEGRDVPTAGKSKFEIEDISLGMTGEQLMNILTEKGYTPRQHTFDSQPTSFQKGSPKEIGSRWISIRYATGPDDKGVISSTTVTRISIMILGEKTTLREKSTEVEKIYNSLAAEYGEADHCRDSSIPRDRCQWTNDQGEKLLLHRSPGDRISMILE